MKSNLALTPERTLILMVRFLIVIILVGVILLQIFLASMAIMARIPVSRDSSSPDKIVSISAGMSGQKIGEMLYDQGLVIDSRLFRVMLRLTNTGTKLSAGEYLLNPSMNIVEIIAKLETGISINHAVTIPEGYTIAQIARLLGNKGLVDEERFLVLANDASLVYGEEIPLDIPIASLEGYLFPDTYLFTREQSEAMIIKQMVDRFIDYVIPNLDLGLLDNQYSLHEVVTLASIVEKEVSVDYERPLVAGVFLNRLEIGMRLQADPTVRYVMDDNSGRVLYRDLEIDSPYNTYRYGGIPPGPIASPGLPSILAVLNPADVNYYYFVARGDGTHHFSETYGEHLEASSIYGY